MVHPKFIAQFKDAITAILPGYIAIFNFADTKRRNCHLGYSIVDGEIEEFTQLLCQAVGQNGYALRVGGARWLGFFAANSFDAINQLLKDFYQEQEILTGWKSLGYKDGVQKSQCVTVEAIIYRSMLCIYSPLENIGDFETTIEQLLDNDYGLRVNIAHNLKQVMGRTRSRWHCVSRYPKENPVCPFCQGNSFEWLDGDTSIYYGYGFCKTCQAEVTFSDVD